MLDELEDMTVARVRSAQGRGEEALALLGHLLTAAEAAGRAGSMIGLRVVEALVHARCGDGARALNALEQALTLAQPEQYVNVFVQEGVAMAELLVQSTRRRAQNDPINGYIGRLLAAFPKGPEATHSRSAHAVPASSLAEPLTERETEVLQLLAAGMTSTDIAQHFVVSINTVKTQLRSIYSKLDVHSRAEAIAKARALHLLP
jgi:LuxR family maltose regulon positive regulatory protein